MGLWMGILLWAQGYQSREKEEGTSLASGGGRELFDLGRQPCSASQICVWFVQVTAGKENPERKPKSREPRTGCRGPRAQPHFCEEEPRLGWPMILVCLNYPNFSTESPTSPTNPLVSGKATLLVMLLKVLNLGSKRPFHTMLNFVSCTSFQ